MAELLSAGFDETSTEPNNLPELKITRGSCVEPDSEFFLNYTADVPKGDFPWLAQRVATFSLIQSGVLPSPEELSHYLDRLPAADDHLAQEIERNFLKACAKFDLVALAHEETLELGSLKLKALQEKTKGAADVPALKIIRTIHKSRDPAFGRFGDNAKRHAAAIIRVLYAWEKGIPMPTDEDIKIVSSQE